MTDLHVIDWIALLLVIVGALNWGFVGFFKLDLVKAIFGKGTTLSRVVYALVGIAGIYVIFLATQLAKK
ncbi:MAG TPA: DUF378 domain-containing protein [Candidatus Saccharimonadales bacterium]|nr:DUF378 domain-containing protein [Candidatus Saccharimonadales bacterium]